MVAGSIGIWFDFSKNENKKWGVFLIMLVIGGGLFSLSIPEDKTVASLPQDYQLSQKKDSLTIVKSKTIIAQYEQLLASFVTKVGQVDSLDKMVSDNLRMSRQMANSYSNFLTNIEEIYKKDSTLLMSNKALASSQNQHFNNTFDRIDSVASLTESVSSNLILLENQLLLPIDHIDAYLRVNHGLNSKVYNYYKLRNHFTPNSHGSKEGTFRVEHQALNDPKSAEDLLDFQHAYFTLRDSTDQKDLIHEKQGFGNVAYEDIYMISNQTADSLTAQIDYLVRIAPKKEGDPDLYVRSLRNGIGRIKLIITESEKAQFKFSFENVYLRIHSGNKEIGLTIHNLTHNTVKNGAQTFEYLEFRLGNDIFDHALVNQ
jgi:hypothetical protein